jgi:hypothetical protein
MPPIPVSASAIVRAMPDEEEGDVNPGQIVAG